MQTNRSQEHCFPDFDLFVLELHSSQLDKNHPKGNFMTHQTLTDSVTFTYLCNIRFTCNWTTKILYPSNFALGFLKSHHWGKYSELCLKSCDESPWIEIPAIGQISHAKWRIKKCLWRHISSKSHWFLERRHNWLIVFQVNLLWIDFSFFNLYLLFRKFQWGWCQIFGPISPTGNTLWHVDNSPI